MMDQIKQVIGKNKINLHRVIEILEESIHEKDLSSWKSHQYLLDMGLNDEQVITLLALHKSQKKYNYNLLQKSISHLFRLSEQGDRGTSLRRLLKYPFLALKAGWLYEHAPYFLYLEKDMSRNLDEFMINFAIQYESLFMEQKHDIKTFRKVVNPKRVFMGTFWENKIIDPVSLIEKAVANNIEGVELSVDFHPFNYTKLLPEEMTFEKRQEIKRSLIKSGIKFDLHCPIVGPYSPHPDPKRGKQNFYNPIECHEIIRETIDLAKDTGAGSVVVHLIDDSDLSGLVDLIMHARGSNVRVTIENYCQTDKAQDSDFFISVLKRISELLPLETKKQNFGITLDVGHFNIEGEDPIIASEKVGNWCITNDIFLRVHATDNYGKLLFSPPAFSADVHGNVSGRGINNRAIIKILRSIGHNFDVVAEQIKPLTSEDINTIHQANVFEPELSYSAYVAKGADQLSEIKSDVLITPEMAGTKAYQFMVGTEGISALREHLVYRKIQDKKYLSVDEAKKMSLEFMRMPQSHKQNIIEYLDELLFPIQAESGTIQKGELDMICQNISGALFGTLNSENLDRIFSKTRICNKDEIICEQDTPGQEIYLIKDGEATVLINNSPIAVLGSGEVFGELSLFYNVKRTATIKISKDNTVLGILNRETFARLLERGAPYCYDLIFRLYHILPDRLRNLNDKYKTAIEALRLISFNDHKKPVSFRHIDSPEIKTSFTLNREEALGIFQNREEFNEGKIIFEEGDEADGAFYIIHGSVKVVTISSDHKEVELGELNQGEVFGEMALIDNKPRSATVVTASPCEFAYMDKKVFNDLLASRSDLSFRFMAFLCLALFNRILRLDREYADLKQAFN